MQTFSGNTKATFSMALMLTCSLAGAAAAQSLTGAERQQQLQTVLEAYTRAYGFMGTVLITKKGTTVFHKTTGQASVEWQIPTRRSTIYPIASITKSFTAAALLRLQEQGKLKLTDPLQLYLPEVPNADRITLHQLLNHTAGLAEITDLPEFTELQKTHLSLNQLINLIKARPVLFQPGETFQYSNSGYLVLSKVIEVVAQKPYQKHIEDEILGPLGLKNTFFRSSTDVVAQLAEGYSFTGFDHLKAPYFDPEIPAGAGGLNAAASDLVKWLPVLLEGPLLSETSKKALLTPQADANDGSFYSYGLTLNEDQTIVQHGGSVSGYQSSVMYLPQQKLSVVVLGNVSYFPADDLALNLSKAYLGQPYTLPAARKYITLTDEELQRIEGFYQIEGTDLGFTIAVNRGHISFLPSGASALYLQPVAPDHFYLTVGDASIKISPDGTLEFSDGVQSILAKRVK